MAAITLSSYKIFCITENTYVFTYGYQEEPPTVCPHDITHSVNLATVEVVNTYTIPGTFILIDTSGTNGNSVAYGVNAEFPLTTPGTIQEWPISALPFSVKVSTITISPAIENFLDIVSIYMPYNKPVGALATAVLSGNYIIDLDNDAYAAVDVGYTLKLVDGLTSEEFQTVIAKNSLTQEVTLSSPTVNSYSIGTIVQISVPRIVDFLLNSASRITLSSRTFTPFLLPAGSAGIIRYKNNDGRYKQLNMLLEYYY